MWNLTDEYFRSQFSSFVNLFLKISIDNKIDYKNLMDKTEQKDKTDMRKMIARVSVLCSIQVLLSEFYYRLAFVWVT